MIKTKLLLFIIILFSFIDLKGQVYVPETVEPTAVADDKKIIGIGVFTNVIGYTSWYNTSPYIINKTNTSTFPKVLANSITQNGLIVNYSLTSFLFLETGLYTDDENVLPLADNLNIVQGGVSLQRVWLNYKVNYLQVPIKVALIYPGGTGIYCAPGVINNFVNYQHLYGYTTYGSYGTYGQGGVSYIQNVNEVSKKIKFNNIVGTLDIGVNSYAFKKRIRVLFYCSLESAPLYKKNNELVDFSFYKFSFLNIGLFYNFKM